MPDFFSPGTLYPIERGPKGRIGPASGPCLERLANRPNIQRSEGLGAVSASFGSAELSQETLADLAHIGRSYMSGIERGVRNCSTLHLLRIAKALHVRIGDLFPE
jgi:DNA-binding XRE family transcriptional regulator